MSKKFDMWKVVKRLTGRPEAVDDETIVYAVGDIHGRVDLLLGICERIDSDIAKEPRHRSIQVFLGDYIDRGPDSSGVIERLAARRETADVVCLRGNHETCLLDFLADPETLELWRQFGGLQTLISYGLSPSARPDAAERRQLADQLRHAMPAAHLGFLRSLPSCFGHGRYFFAHAGIRPGVALDLQRDEDLLWIRDDFLLSEDDFGKVIVHGHTPVREPELRANRINIDTGAYATGRLTCIKLRGSARSLL
jgi:serine/threonine protein phosphatase 1